MATDPTAAPTLFRPLQVREVRLANHVVISPMCQCSCSAHDGHATDWHLVHLGQFSLSGADLTFTQATAVEARRSITPGDLGVWTDSQVAPLRRIVDFVHAQGHKAGIQLAHAGRKGSRLAPWRVESQDCVVATADNGGWPYDGAHSMPRELSEAEIEDLVAAFAAGARRSVDAGFDVIEIHAAHGYLLSEFLSPTSNKRMDWYGGSFENRIRLLIDVIKAVRAAVPAGMPVFVRISATEWIEHTAEPSWDLRQSIQLAQLLPDLVVDLIDVSSGGNNAAQKVNVRPYYQVSLAGQIRAALRREGKHLLVGAVGMIWNADMARGIVQGSDDGDATVTVNEGDGQMMQADLVLVGRQFLREPNFVLKMAQELNVDVKWPNQYLKAK